MSRTFRKLRPRLASEYWNKYPKDKLWDGTQQLASRSCNNHGGCGYCKGNRTHKNKKREPIE